MSYYTVLLVDDEPEIRQGIIRKIDWNKHGFEIIGSAEMAGMLWKLQNKSVPMWS